jgi:hypothetical protein
MTSDEIKAMYKPLTDFLASGEPILERKRVPMNKKQSNEALPCRGCGKTPVIFDGDDYYQNMLFGCIYGEQYWEDKESGAQKQCYGNFIELRDFDGKSLDSMVAPWNAKQSPKAFEAEQHQREEDEKEMAKMFPSLPVSNFLAEMLVKTSLLEPSMLSILETPYIIDENASAGYGKGDSITIKVPKR